MDYIIPRISKHNYYMEFAKTASLRGTCLRRQYGAVIVKNDTILSTGYPGAPRGRANCIDMGICPREKAKIPAGERYELCRSVHAEQNAVINAARNGANVLDADMYIYGYDKIGKKEIVGMPCKMCERVIINAGIAQVFTRSFDHLDYQEHFNEPEVEVHRVADWVERSDIENGKLIRA